MSGAESSKCLECGKLYKRYKELRRHVKNCHPDKLNVIAPLKVLKGNILYKCTHCHRQFSHKQNLNFHVKKVHNSNVSISAEVQKSKQKCPMCSYNATFKKDFIKHYETFHSIPIQCETIQFLNNDDFISWKNKVENETKASFVKEKGEKAGVMNYICHRSGFFTSKSKGQRHLKRQGSKKINGYCPAMIKQVTQSNGKYLVHFIKTHVGHQNTIEHLFLSPSERHTVATKLAAKIPFEAVLDEVRDGISDSDSLERKHLLTKKDLYNIEASFNLQSTTVRHQNDAINLESWVDEMKNDCVLFYKPQDVTMDEYPQLRSDDFVLIIMNSGQLSTFKKFANDCICVDGTHGVNNYNFELHTLLVLDDLRQGFPCCFCISSRTDETIMTLFFDCVKKESGLIQAKIFMSDMADVYYNAWSKVMSETQFRLYCTWHVDRAWRKNLNLINTKEKQELVYKNLRALLQETDQAIFEPMLNSFLRNTLDDPSTLNFGLYFKAYANKAMSWAYCYRMHSGLNTNMHIERMHRTIKYIYFRAKRLDKAVNALMKFIRDKLFDRLIILNKGKSSEEMEIVYDKRTVESKMLFEEIDNQSTSRGKTLTERKEEMLRHLYVMVNDIKTEEQWKALEKMVNPIEPTLAAISQQSISNFELKDAKPSNSKILKQIRLFSTKKTSLKKRVQLTKPTKEECNTIAINLLN